MNELAKPYGLKAADITDGVITPATGVVDMRLIATALQSVAFGDLSSTPTTLFGYGITDAINVSAIGVAVQSYDEHTAKTDIVQVWEASQIADVQAIAFAATIADNWQTDKQPVRGLTLTGDVTSFTVADSKNVASPSDATEYIYSRKLYSVLQDATGGHTLTFTGIGGTEPTIDDAANAETTFEIEIVRGNARFV